MNCFKLLFNPTSTPTIYSLFLGIIFFISSSLVTAQVGGQAFEELPVNGTVANSYGVKDANELGLDGIVVTITDASGNVTMQNTSGGGLWSDPASNFPVRIEFTWPNHSWLESSPDGSSSNTSVRFVSSSNSNIDFGLLDPGCYSEADPRIATTQFTNGQSSGNTYPALLDIRYNSASGVPAQFDPDISNASVPTTAADPNERANANDAGSIYGLAFDQSSQRVYATAFTKRHSGFGPRGIGGVYVFDYDGASGTYLGGFNLDGVSGVNLGSVTRNSSSGDDNFLSTDSAQPNRDMDAFDKVGKTSFGDAEFDNRNGYLWITNLNNPALIRVDVGQFSPNANVSFSAPSGSVNQYALSSLSGTDNCANGVLRPFGLTFHQDKGYLGCVCSGENSSNTADVIGYVYEFDPSNINAGLTQVLTIPMDYNREIQGPWHNWIDDWSDVDFPSDDSNDDYAQPILSDISFDEAGNMLIGVMDRFANQTGYRNYVPVSGSTFLFTGNGGGDLLFACRSGNSFNLEGSGACNVNDQVSNNNSTNSFRTDDGPSGSGEFFYQDYYNSLNSSGDLFPRHNEISLGALSSLKGSNEVITTVYDPIMPPENVGQNANNWVVFASGFKFFATNANANCDLSGYTAPGCQTDEYLVTKNPDGDNSPAQFGKAGGLGDIEILSSPPPIEIGNYVWEDTDMDGIQDPGENALSGIQVELLLGSTVIATASTDANGNYIFSNDPDASSTSSHIYNIGQLEPNMSYTLRFPTTSGSLILTNANLGSKDIIDSDADAAGEITVLTGDIPIAGANNHSFDAGYVMAECELTDAGKSNETCNDNGSTSNSTDDFISFSLEPDGSNLGTGYTVSVDNGGTISPSSGNYGSATNFQLQSGSADGTMYTITITDNSDPNCTIMTTVMQSSCSMTCPPNEHMICDNGSNTVNLTAETGLSNYIWYEYDEQTRTAGTQVGTGQVLTLDGSDIGPAGSRKCYVYTAEDNQGCPGEMCCPVCISTEQCCPGPNCYGINIVAPTD